MARGVRQVLPEANCVEVPMADGGEGTTEALLAGLGGEWEHVRARNALGEWIDSHYGLAADGTAIIESAAAVGLGLIPAERRDIMASNSAGIADLMLDALQSGAKRMLMGLGGSATNDCGAGLLVGLGAKLFDAAGNGVEPLPTELDRVVSVDLSGLDSRIGAIRIDIVSDVNNPLLGDQGASAIFGPQKGATPELVQILDAKLASFATALEQAVGRSLRDVPGAGAAGGLGATFLALGAQMNRGVTLVIKAAGLLEKSADADYVFTGEGSLDAQTLSGKTPSGVAETAAKNGVPCLAFVGRRGPGTEGLIGTVFADIVPIVDPGVELRIALAEGEANLERAVADTMRKLLA
jgi:glycerate kinase